ncbi:putative G-protein coupled receptor 25 [Genypterus blacodes]|uniref:putative G-protein coupled receptor 25 n=1 Tax=Genypterus blacodes TaxID=154954 RepID=UPI003F775262
MDAYTYPSYDDYNFTYNATIYLSDAEDEDCSVSYPHGSNLYLPVLYFLIFFTGFLGNLFVIVVMSSRRRRGGRLVDTFVINLAVADLVFVLTLPLWAVSAGQNGNWNFGPLSDVLCRLSSYIIAVNRFSNIFFLTCMSVDRYLAVARLMDSRFLRNSLRIRATCVAVWLVSMALGIPSLVYRSVDEGSCLEDAHSSFFLGLSLTTVLLAFVLPVCVLLLCYCTILVRLNRHSAAVSNPRTQARRRHSLKMVLSIIGAFVLSWLPFNIFKSILLVSKMLEADLSCYSLSWLSNGLLLSSCLAFFNSCVNPAIYLILDHHFRRQAHGLCMSCTGKPKSPHSSNSSASFTNAATSDSCGTTPVRGHHHLCD